MSDLQMIMCGGGETVIREGGCDLTRLIVDGQTG